MAKRKTEQIIVDLRKLLADNKLIIGADRALKQLKQGKLGKVYFAGNCAPKVKETFERYCSLSKVECEALNYPGEELGVVCKKPFSISVIGVLK
jgi:large subunit ribosomal protein L30e